MDAVGPIGQVLGGAFAVLPDGDDVPLALGGIGITACTLGVDLKGRALFRLFLTSDRVHRKLLNMNLTLDDLVRHRQGDMVVGAAVMAVPCGQLVLGGI